MFPSPSWPTAATRPTPLHHASPTPWPEYLWLQLGSLTAGTSVYERADVLALLEQQEDGEDGPEGPDTVINIEGAVGRAASIMDGDTCHGPSISITEWPFGTILAIFLFISGEGWIQGWGQVSHQNAISCPPL